MPVWNLPPKAKVFEAMSAVADGRVSITGEREARVVSSAGTKSYLVEWSPDMTQIVSNDNASYWQGYMGYPILAVLMVLGKLEYNKESAGRLAGIQWKAINRKFRNRYDEAVQHVMEDLGLSADEERAIRDDADAIYERLAALRMQKLSKRRRPPASKE